jgi:diguanylate cyclase (GGDEF)-like protein
LHLQQGTRPAENGEVVHTSQPGIAAAEGELSAASERIQRTTGFFATIGFAGILVLCVPVAMVAQALASGTAQYVVFVGLMALVFGPIVLFMYVSTNREQQRNHELASSLQHELVEALKAAERETARRLGQVRRQEFETKLANALEMADGEPEVIDAVERALATTLPASPVEMLLADNSHAHLARMAVSSPSGEPPSCPVDSPDQCPAARRAQVQRFDDSDELDACPKLRGRAQGRCSAVCVPVSIMGRTVGVLHATGEPGVRLEEDKIHDLATLANLAGARIGLLRMMAETQLQAATDSLTGLLNRRSLERRVRTLRDEATPFALVMADLDHFKRLNDTYGHETGDRALRIFAQVLRTSLRKEDLVCRHGGEEFALVMPHCSAHDAEVSCEHIRIQLADAVVAAGLAPFTVSFGVVEADQRENLIELIGRADAALFASKHHGRDRITVHDASGTEVSTMPPRAPRRARRAGTSAATSNGAGKGAGNGNGEQSRPVPAPG